MYYMYILRCADDFLYIGHTNNVPYRVAKHNEGRADCSCTINRRPVRVVYTEAFSSRQAAVERERQIKRWTRRKKEALIAGDTVGLKRV